MIKWVLSIFTSSTAEIVFLSICGFGAVISVFSLLFGGAADSEVNGDFGGDHNGGDGLGAGLFSIRGMSLFSTGFGGVAYLVQHFTGRVLVSSVSGFLSGWVFAIIGVIFVRMFFKQQASSLITASQIAGATGIVITSIPAGGRGDIRLTVAGKQITRMAITEGDNSIEGGTPVRVLRVVGGLAIVQKISSDKGA